MWQLWSSSGAHFIISRYSCSASIILHWQISLTNWQFHCCSCGMSWAAKSFSKLLKILRAVTLNWSVLCMRGWKKPMKWWWAHLTWEKRGERNKMEAVQLSIFNENGKWKLLNSGGKDALPWVLAQCWKLLGREWNYSSRQDAVSGKKSAWLTSSRRRYLGLLDCWQLDLRRVENISTLLTFSKLVANNIKGLQLHVNNE